MVLTCFEFEEVECVGESLDSCDQVDFYSQRKRGSDGVETRCYEVLQDGDQYLSQDTCLQARICDDEDHSETLFSSASLCLPQQRPVVPANAMQQMLQAEKEAWSRRSCWQDISASDRASLVDSVTRTATQLQLSSDVLFLAVACLDRVLSLRIIASKQLDTAALACLWIAAKFEHCVVPPAVHFLAAAQADFTSPAARRLLVDMEAVILKALDYRVCTSPTSKTFLRTTFIQMQAQLQQQHAGLLGKQQHSSSSSSTSSAAAAAAGQIDPRLYFCASYLAEMSLLESKLAPFPPSQVAAAAFATANLLVPGALRDAQLQQLTGYSLAQVKEPMTFLLSVHHVLYQGRHLPLTRMYETARKYRHASMCRVGLIPSITSTTDQRLRLYQ
ncbi:hypothetical protein OEZ86_010967 [Tetradesmus obliquus]|nr:hypothetical protein OEZ86_010967 [Tetradesmus obliquus]